MSFITVYFLTCAILGCWVNAKGGNGWVAGILCVFFSPVLIFLVYFFGGSKLCGVKCPRCAETLKVDAFICKHCGLIKRRGKSKC